MNDLIRKINQQVKLNTNNNWRRMHGLSLLRGKNKRLKRQGLCNLQPIENPTLCIKVDNIETVKKFYENKSK